MALSMSVSAGKHNARHNTDLAYRAKLPNVDPKLSSLNFTIRDEPIGKAYDRIFGKSLSDYNAKQRAKGHSERCIADYHAKVEGAWSADSAKVDSHKKGRSNVPKPCYEYVLQLGDKTLNLKRLPDLQNLMMSELEKAAAAHGIERRLMDCDRKHLDVPEYQQMMRNYNDLTDKIEQKRSRVAELDRDIKGKERTVARLDRSIETKTKRLNSLTEWLQEAEKRLDGRFY